MAMTRLGFHRSTRNPAKGATMPYVKMCSDSIMDVLPRFHPNSFSIGGKKTEKEWRTP
jgi:hypothetical protein